MNCELCPGHEGVLTAIKSVDISESYDRIRVFAVMADMRCISALLYLISKCVLPIGRNRVTWRSINLASALTAYLCLHE